MASPLKQGNTSDRTFRVFLLRIAAEITTDLLDSLKFLCQDDLPKGELESVKTPRELLELLWKGDKICLGNVTYLVTLLENVGNIQLANRVREQGMPFSFFVNMKELCTIPITTTIIACIVNEVFYIDKFITVWLVMFCLRV